MTTLGPINGTAYQLEIMREDRTALAERAEKAEAMCRAILERCEHLEQVNRLLMEENRELFKKESQAAG